MLQIATGISWPCFPIRRVMTCSTLRRSGLGFEICGARESRCFQFGEATSRNRDTFTANSPRPSRARADSSMGIDEKRKRRPIARLLATAALDLDAARRLLVDPPNLLAANHLQQAAEKILGAVRLDRGLLNTKDHDLVLLIDGREGGEPRPLPPGDPYRERFRPLEPLSAYATAFRYTLLPSPDPEGLRAMLATLIELHALAEKELGAKERT